MVFQGTRRRSARRLNRDVERAGGTMDAYTSEDHTAIFVRGPGEHFHGFMDVLLDLYQHSIFDPETAQKERDVISEEISMYREQPSQHVEDLLCRTVWPDHPLGQPIAGTETTIGRITAGQIRQHVKQYFGAGNAVMVVAGCVTTDQVRRSLGRLLPRGLPRARRAPEQLFHPKPRRTPAVIAEARDIDQVQLALAFHAPGRLHPCQPALRLLNVILGENTTSRLWVELRENRGLCYDSGSDITALAETGLLHLHAGVDPDKMDEVLKVIFRELRRLAEKPAGTVTLRSAAQFAIASNRMALESTSQQMTMMAESLLLYHREIDLETAKRRLLAVTPADVQRVAASLFRPGRLTVAMVGPEFDHRRVAAAAALLR
jgi:predicted Zn-dependent peptidase